jgi:hypothetical protein
MKKSTTKMATRLITTDAVVDSPTPLAPPVVVCPQPHEMVAITAPNDRAFADMMAISPDSRYLAAESMMAFGEIPYRRSASRMLAAIPMEKDTRDKIGSETAHATTRGATR